MFTNSSVYFDRLWPLLVIVCIVVSYIVIASKAPYSLSFNMYRNWDADFRRHRLLLGFSNFLLLIVCIVILLISMGISEIREQEIVVGDADYILFAFDISPSMAAKDINNESRWQAVKDAFAVFLTGIENTRIGVIVFANSMSMIVPFTEDYRYISEIMDEVPLGRLGNDTALADAIVFSDTIYQSIFSGNRRLVVVTDGVQNSGTVQFAELEPYISKPTRNITILQLGGKERAKFSYVDTSAKQILSGYLNPIDSNVLENFAKNSNISYRQVQDAASLELFFTALRQIVSQDMHIEQKQERQYFTNTMVLIATMLFLVFFVLRHGILRVLW